MSFQQVTVRYGATNNINKFFSNLIKLQVGNHVVVRSERGIEFGEVVNVSQQEMDEKGQCVGQVLRKATGDDYRRVEDIHDEVIAREAEYCRKKITEHGLPMKLFFVEHLFGGDKVIFYFLSEDRVDFRDLVKDLAKEFQTRIELKQVGVRDEARMTADYNYCGRELCCRAFMSKLEPVTMKMAKNQKASLDPAKISGRCGRLMCCLRFEDETYRKLKAQLPKRGSTVKTKDGTGKVIDVEILAQRLYVEMEGKAPQMIEASEVIEVLSGRDKGAAGVTRGKKKDE